MELPGSGSSKLWTLSMPYVYEDVFGAIAVISYVMITMLQI